MTFELTQFNQIMAIIISSVAVITGVFVAIRAGFVADKKQAAEIDRLFADTKSDCRKEIRKTVDHHETHCPHEADTKVLETKLANLDDKVTTGFDGLNKLINKLLKINGGE